MKPILLSILFAVAATSAFSQVQIDNTQTPEQLVLNTFLGENISISNIKFNGSALSSQVVHDQVAKYLNGSNGLLSEAGLILATGKVDVAAGPNDSGAKSSVTATPFMGDPDLAAISGATVRNVCNLEFDFIPNGDTVFFDYIFASEEYPEFANSSFNDTFALLLSGPGISGPFSNNARNIATIPGVSQSVSINSLNNGNSNLGPCYNCAYYVNNGIGNTPLVNTEIQYDGRSTVLNASHAVTAGQTYHLKFIIGNVSDNLYDSAMFLLQGSLRSATLHNVNFGFETVQVLPNPAQDFVQITAAMNLSQVKFYDMQGRFLKQASVDGNTVRVDTTDFNTGTYIMEFVSAQGKISRQKLLVK